MREGEREGERERRRGVGGREGVKEKQKVQERWGGGGIYGHLFLQWHTVDTRGWIEVVSCSYLCHSSLFTLHRT